MFNQQRYPNLIKMNDRFQLKKLRQNGCIFICIAIYWTKETKVIKSLRCQVCNNKPNSIETITIGPLVLSNNP